MTYSIPQDKIDNALFAFLQSIYLFEQREAAVFGVDWSEVYLLQLLIRHPGMRLSEISGRLKVKDFTASRMVTKLENAGLVHRAAAATDKRAIEVNITAAGQAKIKSIEDFNYATISSSFNHVPQEQITMLIDTISQLDRFLKLEPTGG